jgi:hypothetical protein
MIANRIIPPKARMKWPRLESVSCESQRML